MIYKNVLISKLQLNYSTLNIKQRREEGGCINPLEKLWGRYTLLSKVTTPYTPLYPPLDKGLNPLIHPPKTAKGVSR